MAEFQSIFTGQEVDNTINKLRSWIAVDGTYPTVTISSVTYAVIWKSIPASGKACYGIGLHPTTGRPYEIYYNGSSYTATALDADTKNTAGATNNITKTTSITVPAVDILGSSIISTKNIIGTTRSGKTPFVKDFILSYLCSINFAVITTHENLAISDGWNVALPTPNHLCAPLASIPKGVNTKIRNTVAITQICVAYFFHNL